MLAAAKLPLGEIVEITTEHGLRYVQITHHHPSYPEVVRALKGCFEQRPSLDSLALAQSDFHALCPVGDSLAAGTLKGEALGSRPLPDHAHAFPTFRTPIRDRRGDVIYWWFWDGEALRFDAAPPPEAETWPLREITGAGTLLRRLTQS